MLSILPAELFLSVSAGGRGGGRAGAVGAGRRMVLHVNDTREMCVKPATATVLMKRDRTQQRSSMARRGHGGGCSGGGSSDGGGGKGGAPRHGDPVHYLSSLL